MRIDEVIAGSALTLERGDGSTRITDVVEDSRDAVPGCLFIARPGTKEAGETYAKDAAANGAAAILLPASSSLPDIPPSVAIVRSHAPAHDGAKLAERFWGSPSSKLQILGVTGTNGKTTVSHTAWAILNALGVRTGLIGTVIIDAGQEIGSATLTTPPATEVSRSLANMVSAGCKAAVVECSSHALHQGRVAGVHFNTAIFTNLSGDHLDYHQTMEQYAHAKGTLFRELPNAGTAIANAHAQWADAVLAGCPASITTCTQTDTQADTPNSAHNVHYQPACSTPTSVRTVSATAAGMTLELSGPWGKVIAALPFVGEHNAMNTLQALCAAWDIATRTGVDPDQHTAAALTKALSKVTPVPGRLEPVAVPHAVTQAKGPIAVYVDFAHTDDALRTALAAVRPLAESASTKGRVICVFGCGGDRDATKRPRMGEVAAAGADHVIITSDNPRTEDSTRIIEDIRQGVPPTERTRLSVEPDRARAIRKAIDLARGSDIILIAGKGHETDQLTHDGQGGIIRTPFDDRTVAANALNAIAQSIKKATSY